ncbi:DNA repair protein endonuclease SAE2/CtIP C-terminus-domain-containing protein [Nemania sp. FL0916]|nr:DNA repair protein endonuclease SAE2/CtIP C-terminus-domain-containing protein [Nemania sp. FL0916]
MENWFRDVGRTALLDALEETCGRIDSSFRTDFKAYVDDKTQLTTELETLRRKASEVARLEDENKALRAQIKALANTNREQIHTPDTIDSIEAKSNLRTPLAPKSANQQSLKRPHLPGVDTSTPSDLKYIKLQDQVRNLQSCLDKSKELLREQSASRKQWIKHAEQIEEQSRLRLQKMRKLRDRLAEITQEPLSESFCADVEDDAELALLAPDRSFGHEESNLPRPAPIASLQCQQGIAAPIEDAGRSKSPLAGRGSSESTCSSPVSDTISLHKTNKTTPVLPPLAEIYRYPEGKPHIKSEPSSDTPVVVSERSLRKRKYVGNDQHDIGASVKTEADDNSVQKSSDEFRSFGPHESIDFDTAYRRVETPRKHTKYQHTHDTYTDDVDIEDFDQIATAAHVIAPILQDSRRQLRNATTTDLGAVNRSKLRSHGEPTLPSCNNQAVKPRPNLGPSRRNRKSDLSRGLASLAEDGYPNNDVSLSNSKVGSRSSILDQLLRAPSIRKDGPLQPDHGSENRKASGLDLQTPEARELPGGKDRQRRAFSTPRQGPKMSDRRSIDALVNQSHSKARVASRSEEKGSAAVTRLRDRPKTELQLDDFKINPQANEGYDYAFTDVVRKKDERECLQGCVKENCCGRKFRALAHACRASTGPCDFQALLESYLGDDCHQLATMSQAEKETVWIEAKMRELANANGRHRHRFPRMTTPPGFWQPDFPTTQEGEQYNKEAGVLERDIIEERYREAMRPGGLWLFRDE